MWAQTFENVSKESVIKQRKVALAAASPRTRGHAPRPGPAPSGPRDGPDPGSLRRRAPAPTAGLAARLARCRRLDLSIRHHEESDFSTFSGPFSRESHLC